MSAELLGKAATQSIFRPRQRFVQLAEDHVPFDVLGGNENTEARVLRECTSGENVVAIFGPRGGGKSSLIAHTCKRLPRTHIALRVPVSGADDPTDVSVVAAVTLSQALNDIDLDRRQRRVLSFRRADRVGLERGFGAGGTLGGGAIPAALHADLKTLRRQAESDALAVDRLHGIDRLITMLVSQNLRPVFVLEDTEAVVGGPDDEIAQAFVEGPVHAFVHEIDAACMIAIQDVFRPLAGFKRMAATMATVDLPALDAETAPRILRAIVENRLEQFDMGGHGAEEIIDESGTAVLAAYCIETGGDLRSTLAALQSATEYAADTGAEVIGEGQMRAGVDNWRAHTG